MLDISSVIPSDVPEGLAAFLGRPVALPTSLQAMLEAVPAGRSLMADDRRHFPRVPLRARIALHSLPLTPDISRVPQWFHAVSKDISRSGIALFHAEQIFPQEKVALVLLDPRLQQRAGWMFGTAEVRWCRRTVEGCYELGGYFLTNASAKEPKAQ